LNYKEIYGLEFQTLLVFNFDGYGKLAAELLPSIIDSTKLDDLDESMEWRGAAWTPGGKIVIPSQYIELDEKVSGENNLAFEVGSGNVTYWGIMRDIKEGLDVSKFDFLSFYWYGKGDHTTYVLQMAESDENKVLYRFKDTWIGWRKILLPMWTQDGAGNLYGVQFTKETRGVAPWTNVRTIVLSPGHGEINKRGLFHMAEFSFLMPNYEENVNFVVRRDFNNFELHYYDILRLTKNFKEPTSSLILLDSLGAISHDDFREKNSAILNNQIHTKNGDLTRNLIGFKEGTFTGEVYLTGTSVILNCLNSITMNGLPQKLPQNSSAIVPLNFTEFHAIAKHVKVEGGQGYYSNILAEDVTIVFKGSPVRISLGFGSKQELEFNGSEIRIAADSLMLQIRNPKISIRGSGELKQFYGYGDLQVPRKFGALSFSGQDFFFNGVLNCSVSFVDAVTIVDQFRVQGTFKRHQPLYTFDENAAILRSLVFLIPLVALSLFLKRG